MRVYVFECSTDSNLKLFVPRKEIPPGANQYCKGTWTLTNGGTWHFAKVIVGFGPNDSQLTIDSKKAIRNMKKQGFYIALI